LANLRHVQEHLRSKGIECLILAATNRDRLTPDERSTLRDFCADLPEPVHQRDFMTPVAPIVLTGRELAAPPFTDLHPHRWIALQGWKGILDLAVESCRHNLGECQTRYRQPTATEPGRWQFTWPDDI
jgi:hypothetical protein